MMIVLCMVLSMLGTISYATETETTIPDPIFVPDLSEYDGAFKSGSFNTTAKNSVADNDIAVDVWIADWDDVITYTIQRLESKITLVSLTDSKMVIRVTDNLDDSIFDSKLTLNIEKPDGFENVTVKQGDPQRKRWSFIIIISTQTAMISS